MEYFQKIAEVRLQVCLLIVDQKLKKVIILYVVKMKICHFKRSVIYMKKLDSLRIYEMSMKLAVRLYFKDDKNDETFNDF